MWRNTMLPVRVYVVDARVLIPLMVVLVHIRLWTFYVALGGMAVFTALEWLGLTFPAAVRTAPALDRRRPAGSNSCVEEAEICMTVRPWADVEDAG